jgi:hypothetical protein
MDGKWPDRNIYLEKAIGMILSIFFLVTDVAIIYILAAGVNQIWKLLME